MKKFLLVFALMVLVVPFIVSAQAAESAVTTICNVLQVAKTIVAAVGFGIAVILLIVAGIKYMTSGGDAEKAGTAKGAIINAVIGIVIVVAAVFIIGLAQGLVMDVGGTNLLSDPCATVAP
ncbi:MAG: TrbC/VirB2 family protein [bacterium]|nr:TrbC/VirB2 family protein [bacterium]